MIALAQPADALALAPAAAVTLAVTKSLCHAGGQTFTRLDGGLVSLLSRLRAGWD